MILNIAKTQKVGGIENGIYYFVAQDYPHISASELKNAVAFIRYEKLYGRETEIVCEDKQALELINNAAAHLDLTEMPTEKFVYHATDVTAARKILSEGRLLSAVKVRGKTGFELAYEKRNSPWNDPADFFEYIMFCGGDQMTGDWVVLSENTPCEDDLGKGNFNAGVRFYFRYKDLKQHTKHIHDGYHPIKVKDEIVLQDYLHSCIVPEQYKPELENHILPELSPRVFYLPQLGLGISDWAENVYNFVETVKP